MMKRRLFLAIALFLGFAPLAAHAQETITVFAAASMKDALEEASKAYEAESGVKVVLSLAASSVLAKQIEAGAPADAFVSADLAWMDWLAERKLIKSETRRELAGNTLVIAGKPGSSRGHGSSLGFVRRAFCDGRSRACAGWQICQVRTREAGNLGEGPAQCRSCRECARGA